MEFIIRDTNIFDDGCLEKIEKLIQENLSKFDNKAEYRFIIEFCARTSYAAIYKQYQITEHSTEKDIENVDNELRKLLSNKLNEIDKIFRKYNIEVISLNIAGTECDSNIIQFILEEIHNENFQSSVGRGKDKRIGKVSCITIYEPAIIEAMQNMINKEVQEGFIKLFGYIDNTEVLICN